MFDIFRRRNTKELPLVVGQTPRSKDAKNPILAGLEAEIIAAGAVLTIEDQAILKENLEKIASNIIQEDNKKGELGVVRRGIQDIETPIQGRAPEQADVVRKRWADLKARERDLALDLAEIRESTGRSTGAIKKLIEERANAQQKAIVIEPEPEAEPTTPAAEIIEEKVPVVETELPREETPEESGPQFSEEERLRYFIEEAKKQPRIRMEPRVRTVEVPPELVATPEPRIPIPHLAIKEKLSQMQTGEAFKAFMASMQARLEKKLAQVKEMRQVAPALPESNIDAVMLQIKSIRETIRKEEAREWKRIEDSSSLEERLATLREEIAEGLVEKAGEEIEDNNDAEVEQEVVEELPKIKDKKTREGISKALATTKRFLRRKLIKYVLLPASLATGITLQQHSPKEYWAMWENWKERHIDKEGKDDPNMVGIGSLYGDSTNIERTTYDYIGKTKIDYKFGYYITSVFDLTDHTPPQFKVINDREYNSKIDSTAGITTNLFVKFYNFKDFEITLRGHKKVTKEEIGDVAVIGYNPKSRTIRAGHYKEFNNDWMVSETYQFPLEFQTNEDGTINLQYHKESMRMVPTTTNQNEKGKNIPFPIGIVADTNKKTINPYEATHFGTLEGGKVIMVCGDKQLQVNGSFADMYRVYERLKKEHPNSPIEAYLLDNGSYNLPIWNKHKDSTITAEEIKQHMLRHKGGGTALALVANGAISQFEYRNKYKEFEHHTLETTLDSATGKNAVNEHSVIVIHHTGNYDDPNQIIKEFEDTTNHRSAHVLIMKDGTRHLFNTDNDVMSHAGKSDFNDRNKVNFFGLGVEMEGDTKNGHQFTIAQLESMLEYLRPRIKKYNIPLENITTHKIIRDNYLRKHPDEKGILPKTDLDDKVWHQIKDLIAKKLYAQPATVDSKGHKMIGALIYKETYQITKDKDRALGQTRAVLGNYGLSTSEVEEALDWIKKNTA